LLEDPEGRINPIPPPPTPVTIELDRGRAQPPAGATLDEIFTWCAGIKRDMDQHLPAMRELGMRCKHITEFTKRRESTVAWAAARPGALISHQLEKDVLVATLTEAATHGPGAPIGTFTVHWGADSLKTNAIDETDLLFIDTVHTADRILAELTLHGPRVRRYIVLRGTGAYGEKGERDNTMGLFHGIRPWLEKHPEWFVVWHTDAEYGMTALGCQPADRPPHTVHAWPPGYGPGTELKKMLASMNINPSPSCDCNAKAALMDKNGVIWCRENRDMIVGWLKDGAPRWRWTDQITNALRAVASGLAFHLNPLDPFGSLVDEAIRRAEVAGAPRP
jgi:hypothetical protein